VSKDLLVGTLVSIPISLVCGGIVALYSKQLVDWKDGRAKLWALRKASRDEQLREQAFSFVEYPHKFTHFLIFVVWRLVVAFGTFNIGCISELFAVVLTMVLPRDQRGIVDTIAILTLITFGGFMCGIGSIVLLVTSSHFGMLLKAMDRVAKGSSPSPGA
jgi:hypothetical protein